MCQVFVGRLAVYKAKISMLSPSVFLYLQSKLLNQIAIYYEAKAFTISSRFKQFIHNLSTFQTLKTPHLDSSVFKDFLVIKYDDKYSTLHLKASTETSNVRK